MKQVETSTGGQTFTLTEEKLMHIIYDACSVKVGWV